MKIKKESYNRAVNKYARKSEAAFKRLYEFAKKARLSSKKFDELCEIIDNGYIKLNGEINNFCERNEIDKAECFCDVSNKSASRVDEWT